MYHHDCSGKLSIIDIQNENDWIYSFEGLSNLKQFQFFMIIIMQPALNFFLSSVF